MSGLSISHPADSSPSEALMANGHPRPGAVSSTTHQCQGPHCQLGSVPTQAPSPILTLFFFTAPGNSPPIWGSPEADAEREFGVQNSCWSSMPCKERQQARAAEGQLATPDCESLARLAWSSAWLSHGLGTVRPGTGQLSESKAAPGGADAQGLPSSHSPELGRDHHVHHTTAPHHLGTA